MIPVSDHSAQDVANTVDLLITSDVFSLETKRDISQPPLAIVLATATLQQILLDLFRNQLTPVADMEEET